MNPRKSKCTIAQSAALTWKIFIDDSHASVVALETWLAGLPLVIKESYEGQIEALKELASEGLIAPEDTLKLLPVESFPDLFELKWRFKRKGHPAVRVRQYHAEPTSIPKALVATHRHIKDVVGTKDQVRAKQNIEMSHAQLRYIAGAWGEWKS